MNSYQLVWSDNSQETIAKITKTLPKCRCGDQFSPSCGPKCKHCNKEIPIVKDAVEYLNNPNMIVVDGACAYSDTRAPYMVRIKEQSTPQHNKTIKAEKN